jgi:hypothetical protein
MKMLSSLASATALLALALAAPAHAAPPAKSPPMSAYVHDVMVGAGGNICANDTSGTSTVLNNPLANGNPNAVIVATFNAGPSSGPGERIAPPGILNVFYDDTNFCGNAANRWVLSNSQSWQPSLTPLTGFERFNIVVVAP